MISVNTEEKNYISCIQRRIIKIMSRALTQLEIDEKFMAQALKEAQKAYDKDEVPVGVVIVKDGKIIARAHNTKEETQDALHHSELLAIHKACKKVQSWRLIGCDIYVTMEPCYMCSGAIVNSRINRVVFGAFDPKAGCCGSIYNLVQDKNFNHRVKEVVGGVLEKECSGILSKFFAGKRKKG